MATFALTIQKLCSFYSCKSLLSSAFLLFWDRKLYYAIRWHVTAFKLSFLCQSPASPRLSRLHGITFYCGSETRWLEPHPPMRKHPIPSPHPPPGARGPRSFKGFSFFSAFCIHFSFQFPSQLSLKLTCSDYSFLFTFTPQCTRVQNTNPFWFCCACESHLGFRETWPKS